MPEFLQNLLSPDDFMPHGRCYQWLPSLVWMHVIADGLIALAYATIPFTMLYLVRKRRDLPFSWMFVCFGTFIVACGATHVLEIWNLWHAAYYLAGAVKIITAIALVATGALLVRLVPQLIALPNPRELSVSQAALVKAESLAGQLRSIAEAIPDIVWTATPDGNHDFYNQRWFDYTGLTLEQTRGWGWRQVLHPDDLDGCVRRWTYALQTGTAYEVEYRFRRAADGDYRWHLGRASPVRNGSGAIVKWFGTSTDIDDQKRTEDQLRHSEQRYRSLIEASSALIWTNSPEGEMRGEQRGWAGYTGQSFAQYQGYGWSEAVHPDDRAPTIERWQRSVETLSLFEGEHRVLGRDGKYRWFSVRAVPLLNEDGRLREWVGVHTDVEAQRQADEERAERQRLEGLRQGQEYFRNAFEHSGIGMALVGLDRKPLLVNAAFGRILGYSREELLGVARHQLTHPDDLANDLEFLQRVSECPGAAIEREKRYIHKDGSVVWTLVTGSLIQAPDGQVRHFIVQIQDTTAKRRAAEELRVTSAQLRRSEALFRGMAQNFPNGAIVLFDADLRYLAVGGAGLADVGLSREAMEGKTVSEVFSPEVCAQLEPDYRAALLGTPSRAEVAYTDRIYDCRVNPVRDSEGKIVCGMVVTQDVTALKRNERELVASLREKEVLLKEIHHRVKNNLQVICSLLNLQARKVPDGASRDALQESQGRVKAIAEFHDRLYRARNLSDVDSTEYVQGLARGALGAFARSNVQLQASGDPVSLGMDNSIPCGLIVNELVTNSLKHAFPGGRAGVVRVGLQVLRGEKGEKGEKVLLSVEDDGIGLPADFEERRGRSLGLQLVDMLARQLGGSLAVQAGASARFEILFPLNAEAS